MASVRPDTASLAVRRLGSGPGDKIEVDNKIDV